MMDQTKIVTCPYFLGNKQQFSNSYKHEVNPKPNQSIVTVTNLKKYKLAT